MNLMYRRDQFEFYFSPYNDYLDKIVFYSGCATIRCKIWILLLSLSVF